MGSGLGFLRRGDWPSYRFQFRPRNSAGTKEDRPRPGLRQHCGVDTYAAGTAIEDVVDIATEGEADVVGGGGREFGGAVGAGRGEWNAGGADESKGDRMRGHAEADGGEACGDYGRNGP